MNKKAYDIMNYALMRLYSIKELSSEDIVKILEEYANNEKWQMKQDESKKLAEGAQE